MTTIRIASRGDEDLRVVGSPAASTHGRRLVAECYDGDSLTVLESPVSWTAHRPGADPENHIGGQVGPRTYILLSTYNGAHFLVDQLRSLGTQTHMNWTVYWRDDGSDDATLAIMADFASLMGVERCAFVSQPTGRLRPAASFIALLRAALPAMAPTDVIAFADQDDVWLPEKLARGVKALAVADPAVPTLYCARLSVVDAALQRCQETTISQRHCGFPASLTQNIATGCTVMLNHAAAALIAGSEPPATTLHDWWSYLLVTAAGGQVVVDDAVVALYRQHGANVVGMHSSQLRRAIAAARRGPSVFMKLLRQHVDALLAQRPLVCEDNYALLRQLHHALHGNYWGRLGALRLPGLRRQNALETLLFRLWFLIG